MAFASEVRTEILENLTLRKKFRRAQGYGLLLCSKHFDAGEISMTTERQEIAQLYRATLRDILGKGCEEIPITRTGMGNATRHYAVALSHPASRQKVLEYFGQQGDQINAEMIAREGGSGLSQRCLPGLRLGDRPGEELPAGVYRLPGGTGGAVGGTAGTGGGNAQVPASPGPGGAVLPGK